MGSAHDSKHSDRRSYLVHSGSKSAGSYVVTERRQIPSLLSTLSLKVQRYAAAVQAQQQAETATAKEHRS